MCHEIRARELAAAIRISSRICRSLSLLPPFLDEREAVVRRIRNQDFRSTHAQTHRQNLNSTSASDHKYGREYGRPLGGTFGP
jgi:hypothetical protein